MPDSDSERSPLLSPSREDAQPTESSPLLGNQQDGSGQAGQRDDTKAKPPSGHRWPSIIAMVILGALVIAILLAAIFVPPAVKHYCEKATVLEPTNLSIDSITATGVRARVQGYFHVDSARVEDDNARRIGHFLAIILRKMSIAKTTVSFRVPQYGDSLVGTALVPPQTASVLSGHVTPLDFIAHFVPGEATDLSKIVNDWLKGNLAQLTVVGAAPVAFNSGFLPLGTHDLSDSMVFEADEMPSMPDYEIQRLTFRDIPVGDGHKAVGADVSVTVRNDYPLTVDVPSVGFDILVPNCVSSEPYIKVAEAVTEVIEVRPRENVTADAKGIISEFSESLTRACPPTKLSPLDHFMKHYLHGEEAEVFVRGRKTEDADTPDWVGTIINDIILPLEVPGKSFGNMIRNFSLTDVDFQLPSPFAEPGDPESRARVSGLIEVLAAMPPDMNVDLGVKGLKADSDLFYEGRKLGELNLDHWQKANSTKVVIDDENLLNITSRAVEVPLNVTDGDVFGDVMQAVLFGTDDVMLDIKAAVDVKMSTVLGNLVVKEVPAEGQIPVKQNVLLTSLIALPGDSLTSLQPRIDDMRILETSETGWEMQAIINFTNPTPYTAFVPYINAHVFHEGLMIGEASVKNVQLQLGNNTHVVARATWDPVKFGGVESHAAGQRLLSAYASGKNSTLMLRTHRGSIPAIPVIGEALSNLNLTMPAPRVRLPRHGGGDDDEDSGRTDKQRQRFIQSATFHFFSSTAVFTLASPLHHNTVYIDYVNATAFYNHTEPVGRILHDKPIAAPPGLSVTPRLPVEWSTGHVGYDKVREALGGSLKLDAVADVSIRIGNWAEDIFYEGQGIGAKIRL